MYIRQIQYRVFGLAFRKFVKTGDRHSKLSNLSNSFLRCSVCDLRREDRPRTSNIETEIFSQETASYTMVRTVCHTADKEKTGGSLERHHIFLPFSLLVLVNINSKKI